MPHHHTQRPNLKNLSHGLNLSRGSNMVGSTLNCIKFFKILAGAQLKLVIGRFKLRLKFIKFGHWGLLDLNTAFLEGNVSVIPSDPICTDSQYPINKGTTF